MTTENPINRANVTQIITLLDYAFKRGVIDAADVGDDYYCEDFISRRETTDTYGLLDSEHDMRWEEWRFIIAHWCTQCHVKRLRLEIIEKLKSPNYLMVTIAIVQDFYVLGIKEWLEYKNPVPLEVFRHLSRVHWKPVGGIAMKPISRKEMIDTIQACVFDREHRAEENRGHIKGRAFRIFSGEIWRATRQIQRIKIIGDY